MTKFYFLLFSILWFQIQVSAQVTLGTSPYFQDFNSISSGLPTGWSVRTGATASALGTTATLVTTNTAWNSTTGNYRNVAAASGLIATSTTIDQNNSVNRALAVRQTGSLGDPGAAFVLQVANTAGLTNFQLSFKLQSLDGSVAGRTTTWRVDYGFGATPTSFTTVATTPATLTTSLAAGGISWGSTDVTINFGTTLDNSSDNVWIRVTTLTPSTGSGSRPTSAIDDFQLSYAAGDVTPPSFTATYPKISNLTSSGFDLITNHNEIGKTYLVILPNNAAAPTSAQVKSGQDATGASLPSNLVGSVYVTVINFEYAISVAGLSDNTDYDVYAVAEDLIPNIQATPTKIDVKTNTAGDVTPPTFSSTYPNINSITPGGFIVRTSLDEAGKTFFVVLPSGANAPSPAQVKNGQDGVGATLASNLAGTITVNNASSEFALPVSGLNSNTAYDVFLVAEDNVPNLQASPVKITVTTGMQFQEDFNACDGASFTQFSVTGAQVWGCTDFGRNATKGIRMNGFAGTAQLNEDWLISPVTTLSANASLSFYSQFSFAGPALQLKISTNYTGSGDPTTATWTDLNGNFPSVAVASNSTSPADWTFSNVDLSAYASQNVYVAFVYNSSTTAAARWSLDDISFSNAMANYLQASPSTLLFTTGGTVKNYSLRGFNLSNNVSIIAPTNFAVSKDNNTFSSSISYTPAEVTTPQTVYVKFDAPMGTTATFTGSIINSSAGVSNRIISVSGTDKSQTLDIATYNLEFFGTDVKDTGGTEFGPIDDALQVSNVTTVIQTTAADIYAVQEVADDNAFNLLLTNLPGYTGFLANRWSRSFDPPDPNFPPQKIGFVYNSSVVQLVSSRVMFAQLYDDVRAGNTSLLPGYPTTGGSTPSSFWSSGRLPVMATFDVIINGVTKRVRVINIHAKSGSATADYDRRKYDVKVLHDSLTANYSNDNIVLLGDFNDDVDVSIGAPTNPESTYKPFVDNTSNFNTLTLALSQAGGFSFPNSNSFLDHIITSNELTNSYVSNSITVEDARAYISNYVNTTSDHLPVSARFVIEKENQTILFNALPSKIFGDAAFTLTATASSGLPISYSSSDATIASVSGTTVTILKTGTVDITASQSGSANFNAAANVSQQLTINKANQTITFNALPDKTFGAAAFNLTATTSSGLPINYSSSDATIASLSGNTVTILKAGTVTITAGQPGDGNFNAANSVVQQLIIDKANQTIAFPLILVDKTLGDAPFTFTLPTSTSGLTVTTTPNARVTINGNQITLVSAGKASITASQAGNSNYNAATSVVREFCVSPAKPSVTVTLSSGIATLTSNASSGNQWYLNGAIVSGATNSTYTATTAGTYKVQVTIDNCVSDFSTDTPVIITGDLPIGNASIGIYPNPTTGSLYITGLEPETKECVIIDLLGRSVQMGLEKVGDQHRLTTDGMVEGVYTLRVVGQHTSVQKLRFIKRN
ncbi:MAG: choice-of-anchor J domain-containing protein [Cytophagales bacterium]|jgi:endonuclease/exonuclease/phosphatase family metal-dependent hydrolase|nr:choice-of-anchor J domain-containing protein [Cytophagales bacterium]MCA6389432.1 choice-of-anchor J domain-containing protein [Cytophagales bacterium]MCA6392277.1 choice-of-anchor J domain-containing protein [Cytophagales bacterium]MCA6394757.1 choice-of-anchor J domain-containing protein [Cytophagales bacterium]MCA6398100.1 choice-of-anchor J domain-containing protein [Cytophagales bacterium]